MKKITIDCSQVASPRELHKRLSEALSFPEWYGNNLDALYDCLTAISQDTEIALTHLDELGIFAGSFHRVMADAEEDNPNLKVTIL